MNNPVKRIRFTIQSKKFTVELHAEPEYSVVLCTPNGNECFEYDNREDANNDYSTICTVLNHVEKSL